MTENSKYTPEFEKVCKKFDANYENIASYVTNQAKDVFLGDKNNQVCRFCGRKKGEVTFKKKRMLYPI